MKSYRRAVVLVVVAATVACGASSIRGRWVHKDTERTGPMSVTRDFQVQYNDDGSFRLDGTIGLVHDGTTGSCTIENGGQWTKEGDLLVLAYEYARVTRCSGDPSAMRVIRAVQEKDAAQKRTATKIRSVDARMMILYDDKTARELRFVRAEG